MSLDELLNAIRSNGSPRGQQNPLLQGAGQPDGMVQFDPSQLQTLAPPDGPAPAGAPAGPLSSAGSDATWAALEKRFGTAVDALPAAPAGDAFKVPAISTDPQRGQLIPLTGGQPTPIVNPMTGLQGSKSFGPAGAPQGVSAPAPAPAPAPVSPSGPAAPVMASNADGTPFIAPNGAKLGADNSDLLSYLAGQGRSLDPKTGKEATPQDQFMRMPGGNMMPVGTPQQQAAANYLFAAQTSQGDPMGMASILQSISGAGDEEFKAKQAALSRGSQTDLQKLANQGHLDVAREASRAQQFGQLDQMEGHIRDAVGKGLTDKATGQSMIDFINARRQSLGVGGAPTAAPSTPPGGAPGQVAPPGAAAVLSPPIQAGGDFAAIRGLLGATNQQGKFEQKPQLSGADITQMIDGLDPSKVPQLAAAIRGGQFGDPMAIRNAALNSLAQNYLSSQGQLPGGRGALPGSYTIPYGDKPLMSLIASSPANLADRASKRLQFANTGVPYDTISLPDGTKIPFDPSGVTGISEGASAFGINQQKRAKTGQRLTPLAQLLVELNQGQGAK